MVGLTVPGQLHTQIENSKRLAFTFFSKLFSGVCIQFASRTSTPVHAFRTKLHEELKRKTLKQSINIRISQIGGGKCLYKGVLMLRSRQPVSTWGSQ